MSAGAAAAISPLTLTNLANSAFSFAPVVAITKVKNDKVGYAVEEAIDLLGGIKAVTRGKNRILLKPNLVAESPDFTTKPEVMKTLVQLMKAAGKDVTIGEGSAAADGFNVMGGETFRTKDREILDRMQRYVFDRLGYTELAKSLDIPLVNLHSGQMVTVPVPGAHAFTTITLHRAVAETDMICSVPMMKTHVLATVTLGMKNLIGLYPGTVYSSVRSRVHDQAAKAGSPGIAYEILDMVNANTVALVVVDGSMAMEGDGPTAGQVVKMGVIVAGTNPLATDMVAARIMGFANQDVPTFRVAQKAGMTPTHLDEIEIRGEKISSVERRFARPKIVRWDDISHSWGVKEM
ncbi:MAG: DUF362 domain-containing protein [Bacteroidota bacterium]